MPASARRTSPTTPCFSTCGPTGSSRPTRRAGINWLSSSGSISRPATQRPNALGRSSREFARAACAMPGTAVFHFMTLVLSLLQAIVLMDGEALVLHVGDKPYVVAESGQVTLANTPLTATSIGEVIHELLPPESRRVLEEVGATQCLLPKN